MAQQKRTVETNETAVQLHQKGLKLLQDGRLDEALAAFQEAKAVWEKIRAGKSGFVSTALAGIAGVFKQQGKLNDAVTCYEEAIRIEEAINPIVDAVANISSHLAGVLEQLKRFDDALMVWRKSADVKAQLVGLNHPDTALMIFQVGRIHLTQGRLVEARAEFEKLEELFATMPNVADNMRLAVLPRLAEIDAAEKRHADAARRLEEVLPIVEKVYGPKSTNLIVPMRELCNSYLYLGRFEDAEKLTFRRLTVVEHVVGRENPEYGMGLAMLVNVYREQKKFEQGLRMAKEVTRVTINGLGPSHPKTAEALLLEAELLRLLDRNEEAEALEQRAAGIERQGS